MPDGGVERVWVEAIREFETHVVSYPLLALACFLEDVRCVDAGNSGASYPCISYIVSSLLFLFLKFVGEHLCFQVPFSIKYFIRYLQIPMNFHS
jgi:hypothetical protein